MAVEAGGRLNGAEAKYLRARYRHVIPHVLGLDVFVLFQLLGLGLLALSLFALVDGLVDLVDLLPDLVHIEIISVVYFDFIGVEHPPFQQLLVQPDALLGFRTKR